MNKPGQLRRQYRTKTVPSTPLIPLANALDRIPWVALWNVSLAVGGIFLISYFASIGFLPDFDLKNLTATIAAVALVGMFLVLFIGLGLVLPGLCLEPSNVPKRMKYALLEATLGTLSAFAFVMAFDGSLYQTSICSVLILIFFAIAFWIAYVEHSKNRSLGKFLKTLATSKAYFSPFTVFMWMGWAVSLPMLHYMLAMQPKGEAGCVSLIKLFLFPAALALLSFATLLVPKHRRIYALAGIAFLAAFLLGVFANRPLLFPQITMKALGLSVGNDPVSLALTESGCNAVNALIKGKPCVFDTAAKLGRLSDTRLVSRVGTQMVIDWKKNQCEKTQDSNANWHRVILNKADVIAWSYDYGDAKSNTAEGDCKP